MSDRTDIMISGYYGHKNSGDDALLAAIIESLRTLKPELNITVLSANPKETRKSYNVNAINRFNIPYINHTLKKTRLLISGGGSLIQDVTSTQSLVYYLSIINAAKRAGAQVMVYANGIGPILNKKNCEKAAKALNRVDYITLREEGSLRELVDLGVTSPPIEVTADPAFGLEKTEFELVADKLMRSGYKTSDKYFGISVREWKNNCPDFEQSLAQAADKIHEKYGLKALFIPMQYPADVHISNSIASKMKTPCVILQDRYDVCETLAITSRMEFIIGMRLHILIYAASLGVPVLGMVYDPKVKSTMDYMGQLYCVDVSHFKSQDILEHVDGIYKDSDNIRKHLRGIGELFRAKAKYNAEIALKLLNQEE